ncbi:MAG: YvcK family protein [Anaerolineae bacterium]|jgi:uncharacterized cofD-like protein|nr:YvcK family protein [Anaerolineae bacterium]
MKRRVILAGAQSWPTHLKWLTPGIGVKRWLLLLALGVGLLSLGGTVALRAAYPLPRYFYYVTLQFLPRGLRAFSFLFVATGIIGYAVWGLSRALLVPIMSGAHPSIPQALYDYRRRGRGPRIVVIGGGHGQSSVLRGMKAFTSNLTAIVTVADDGGSSGRLRRDVGILPPGDFRNCIAALADDEALMTRLFQYRFANGKDLSGHSFGNLFITAMAGVTGSFESALKESSQVLAVQGRVLPSTLEAVTLCADVSREDGSVARVCGESAIPLSSGRILRVTLIPESPNAYPGAIQAILAADLVVIGPGSLYTSILANLLVPQILEALKATRATLIYVCNVATQPGETDGYTAQEHVRALERHIGEGVIDRIVVNTHLPKSVPIVGDTECDWVRPEAIMSEDPRTIVADLVDRTCDGHHNSERLAEALLTLLKE